MHCSLSLGALTAFAVSASCLSAVSAQQDPAHLRLRYATFDPLDATPAIPAPRRRFLSSGVDRKLTRIWSTPQGL